MNKVLILVSAMVFSFFNIVGSELPFESKKPNVGKIVEFIIDCTKLPYPEDLSANKVIEEINAVGSCLLKFTGNNLGGVFMIEVARRKRAEIAKEFLFKKLEKEEDQDEVQRIIMAIGSLGLFLKGYPWQRVMQAYNENVQR
ncbi:hypothetical protein ACFLY6_00420 [Candidatus Dependentiae bacterium]